MQEDLSVFCPLSNLLMSNELTYHTDCWKIAITFETVSEITFLTSLYLWISSLMDLPILTSIYLLIAIYKTVYKIWLFNTVRCPYIHAVAKCILAFYIIASFLFSNPQHGSYIQKRGVHLNTVSSQTYSNHQLIKLVMSVQVTSQQMGRSICMKSWKATPLPY